MSLSLDGMPFVGCFENGEKRGRFVVKVHLIVCGVVLLASTRVELLLGGSKSEDPARLFTQSSAWLREPTTKPRKESKKTVLFTKGLYFKIHLPGL